MQRFKTARENAGLSQKYVAIALNVSQPSVSDWENGKSFPSIDNMISLASLYHVSIDYLLGVSDTPVLNPLEETKQPVNRDELLGLLMGKVISLPLPHLLQMKGYLDGLTSAQDSVQTSLTAHNSNESNDL